MEEQQRIGVLVELPQVLREKGQDPATIIARADINPGLPRNPENSLSFVELDRLLMGCVAATKFQHFGLLVGQRSATLNPPPRPCLANCCHQFIRTSRLNCRIKPLTS
ncbi:AraC family transcriptional regulator [Bradyrhizobium sp. UFLA03-84]|uniref:AraC family transcriptional regulator n=1 Tax=Bradyrhizobium sp. UFLA03-84 TaxID=418599 RepID=UPI001178BABB|nr:AraC family transcriptional regulator [Bradyrhizobium sp. UFLA03-84]